MVVEQMTPWVQDRTQMDFNTNTKLQLKKWTEYGSVCQMILQQKTQQMLLNTSTSAVGFEALPYGVQITLGFGLLVSLSSG